VFCPRRGNKVLELAERIGLSDEGHVVEIVGLLKKHRLPREKPVVVIDREGEVGWKVLKALRIYLQEHPGEFELVPMRTSDRAKRKPGVFQLMKDELVANLYDWFRDGGSIPDDAKLTEELHALAWEQQTNGRLKVTPKKQVRRKIGRSTDRFDALALSAWEPLSLRDQDAEDRDDDPPPPARDRRGRVVVDDDEGSGRGRAFDPYRGGLR
jgi:hypothetical protein